MVKSELTVNECLFITRGGYRVYWKPDNSKEGGHYYFFEPAPKLHKRQDEQMPDEWIGELK